MPSLRARKLVVRTRDGGWDLWDRVADPPIGELPADPTRAAVRVRDELLRRASEFGLEDGELAEIADRSPQTVRIAVDRAAMYDVPLPEKAALGEAVGTGGSEGPEA